MSTSSSSSSDPLVPKTYPCPRCGTQATWEGNASKPFCSERCKIVDLGAWASEEYSLPAEISPFSDEL